MNLGGGDEPEDLSEVLLGLLLPVGVDGAPALGDVLVLEQVLDVPSEVGPVTWT